MPLITYDSDTSQYNLHDDTLEFLNGIGKPLAILGVAGMYRTGKSYLLNRLILNQNKGFGVGPTINPCTKGIWIWGTPIIGKKDGVNCNVLLIDSEGIGALQENAIHD